jgi:FkbH-like protein
MKLREALTLLRGAPPANAEPLEAILICGCTPLHLQTFLAAHLRLHFPTRLVKVETGTYGDVSGSLRRLRGAAPEAVAVVLEWPDLDPRLGIRRLGGWRPGDLPDILRTAAARADELIAAIAALAGETSVALCPPSLPIPPIAYQPGWQLGEFEARLRLLAARITADATSLDGVRVVGSQRLDLVSPPSARLDVKSELFAGFPYRLSHAAAIAELLAQLIGTPTPKKGVITDLDGTLWRGILGDVGADGVGWDGHAHAHALYQQLLSSLAEAGVLVAVASKNDAPLVEEAFRRSDCLLARDQVFPCEVHWGLKSHSIARILDAWRIGADSVVFVDDDPMQLAEVKAAYPEIECLVFPQGDQEVYELLVHLRDLFGRSALTEEDRLRSESLRRTSSARLRAAPEASEPAAPAEIDWFLAEAEATLKIETAKEPLDLRGFELLNKTNQFNLNGKRITEGAWRAYLREQGTFLLTVSYRDKFGALGKIAVLSGRRTNGDVRVEYWVMSCRAFSRRIEHRCLQLLFDRFSVATLTFDFLPTPRNGPLRTFLSELLGVPPQPGLVLTREQFALRCPPLFHALEATDGE